MEPHWVTVLVLGAMLGLRHALEADHLMAVSALLARKNPPGTVAIAVLWGVGHSVTILLVGILAMSLKWTLGGQLARAIELVVALTIVALGGKLLVGCLGDWRIHRHPHTHDRQVHTHLHIHGRGIGHGHSHRGMTDGSSRSLVSLPLLVGMLHGLAGSAVLTLLVATSFSTTLSGITFLLVFGVGSIIGMTCMSFAVGRPLRWVAARSVAGAVSLRLAIAAASIALGLFLGWEVILGPAPD